MSMTRVGDPCFICFNTPNVKLMVQHQAPAEFHDIHFSHFNQFWWSRNTSKSCRTATPVSSWSCCWLNTHFLSHNYKNDKRSQTKLSIVPIPLQHSCMHPSAWRHSALEDPEELKQHGWASPASTEIKQQGGSGPSPSKHRRGMLWITLLCLVDRRTCRDTVSLSWRDWWRGEWAGLAGALHGLFPVERINRNWLPFGSGAVSYSPCGLRPVSRCASEQYLQRHD